MNWKQFIKDQPASTKQEYSVKNVSFETVKGTPICIT